MSYVVLARKWRPMRFEDLVGQDHVARTLGNAIESGRVAHAFLFTGVRGVGKTTSARILAKALNCMRKPGSLSSAEDPGPTATPCLECPACLEIAHGSDVDVREIDGASYNGVDEVRKLQDSLPYQPTRDRYKIIIVDEVHMLSQSAWNAFLKTLEEPPAHVKFIFATTEVHKVPITILSRVQRFDFKLISRVAIIERLKYVLTEEGIAADDESLSLVARQAAGSMRDAMSLLDQVIAWSGDTLVGKDVALVLGAASRQALNSIARGLLRGEPESCLKTVSELVEEGYDVNNVAKDLLGLLRDMAVARVCTDPSGLIDSSEEEQKEVQELAKQTSVDDLVRLHQGFSEGFDDIARSGQARAALEMLLVRLCRRPPLLPIDDLIQRLQALESRIVERAGAERLPAAPPAAPRGTAARGREARTAPQPRPEKEDASEEPPPAGVEAPRVPAASSKPAQAAPAPAASRSSAVSEALPPQPRTHARAPTRPPTSAPGPNSKPPADNGAPAPATADNTTDPPVRATSDLMLNRFRDIVEAVRESRPELAAFLEHAAVLKVEPGHLLLAYPPQSMFSEQVKGRDCMDLLSECAGRVLEAPSRAEFRFDYAPASGMDTLSADRVRAREARMRKAIADAKNHPRVTEALEVLGARIKDLKIGEGR